MRKCENMKRLLSLSVAVFVLSTLSWAQTVVNTDAEIRAAIQVNDANIQLGADIDLSNSTPSSPTNRKASTKSKIENRKSRIVRSSETANSSSSVMTKHSTPSAQR